MAHLGGEKNRQAEDAIALRADAIRIPAYYQLLTRRIGWLADRPDNFFVDVVALRSRPASKV